jgi:hypothetical protein
MEHIIKKGVELKDELKEMGVSIITVYHDDWCDLLNQKGPCNCNPDIGNPTVPDVLKSS